MDLSNDLISKFVKITNDDKNENSESTVYGTVVEYNGGMYVRIDGSDLLTPVETTADFKPNERVTVMIKNHSATVTGNITSPATNEGAVTEKVTKAVEDVEGKVITEVEILIADRVSTKQLDAEVARIDELIAGKASVEDLTATNAEITNLKAEDAKIENLLVGKASIKDLTATNAEITNLKAKDAEIENLVADKASIEDLTATNARIDSLQANKADITYLDANFATIDELEAAHADIEILDAEVANINTLVNGNLTSDNILSLNITSQNTTMENAFVKDAMIDTVTANKIMSGTIDTNKVTIQSTDGSMLLQGTLLQMKDDNGKVRIQIGKDTGGNFTFVLYDESGTGVLIDEEGIKSSDAIADGLIVDAKVADNANIAGSKLDIASVITEVNNDNSTTIKSNKIYLDEQGQSLEVAFNSLKTHVDTIQDVTIDGDLTEVIEQVQSNTTQIAANKEGISTLVSENTSRKEEIQNLDGEIESVNNTLSSKYSSLEQDVSGFKTTVADTYATKQSVTDINNNLSANYTTTSAMNSAIQQKANEITSSVSETYTTKAEFNNLEVGGRNLLENSSFKKDINKWHANDSSFYSFVTNDGKQCCKIDMPGLENGCYLTQSILTDLVYGETYTVSGWVKTENIQPGTTNYTIMFYIDGWYDNNGVDTWYGLCDQSFPINTGAGSWQHIYGTFTVNNPAFRTARSCDFFVYARDFTGQVYFYDVKLEKGNKATDWSPAPEDVQGQIDDTNANLQNNYSTTSAMNSAIQQKANEITSSVSETYATKAEFNNLQIGGTNLLPHSGNFKDNCGLWITNGSSITLETVITYNGHNTIKIHNDSSNGIVYSEYISLKPNTTYTYSITAVASGVVTGDNTRPLHMWVHPQGDESNPHREEILDSSHAGIGTSWGRSYIVFKTPDTDDFYLMKPFIYLTEGQIIYIANFKVEEGNRPTDWSPAPEDVQGQIDDTNNNLQNNYSTTSQMNSAIQQKANEITSTVSETYTTKSEFNNLQIGGTNLIQNGNFKGAIAGSTSMPNPWTFWGTDIHIYGSHGMPGYDHVGCVYIGCNLTDGRQSGIYSNRIHVSKVEKGANYMASFIFATESNVKGANAYIEYLNDACDQIVNSQVIASARVSTNIGGNGLNEHQYHIPFTMWTGDFSYVQITFNHGGTNVVSAGYLMIVGNVQIEKGNKATAWSPAPEDIQGQIDATNANLQNNYSTTSAMNSAIQQKANEITSSVSQTYATKQSVTDINNNLANNYSTTSQMNSAIQQKANEITSTVSQTYISNYEAKKLADTTTTGLNKYLFERYQRDGFDYGARPTLNDLVGARLIESQLMDSPPPHTSYLGDNYIGVLTFYLYYDYACTKTTTITTDDNGTVYLNNVGIYDLTTCQPANVTFNMIKGLNRIDIIYAEGGGGDGVSWGGVDGWSAFGAYANVVTNEIANRTNELTLAMTQGNMLYTDPTFRNGENYTFVYNNLGNNTVIKERITSIEGCPNTSGYCLKITTNGEATPGLGGFAFGNNCRYNAVFITKITAKIPVGYWIEWASNAYGDNGERKWLSSTSGTGDWYDYYFKVKCGDYGSIANTNYFYLYGPQASAENPVIWYVSYATVFDVTDSDERITNLTNNLAVNYSTTSQMNSAIQQKANEITSTVSQTYTTKSEFNSLNIGSTNLVGGTKDFSGWGYYNLYMNKINETAIDSRFTGMSVSFTLSASDDYCDLAKYEAVWVEPDTEYTLSFWARGSGQFYTYLYTHDGGPVASHYNSSGYSGTQVDGASIHTLSSNDTYKRYWVVYRTASTAQGIVNLIAARAAKNLNTDVNMVIYGVKFEKGNRPTDWSPAPEDVQGQIDATNNNLANNYSTTSQMNSAIQQKANEITSSVSQTYTTKSETTAIQNQITTSRNLLMGSRDYNLGKWGTERATILDEWYNGTRIYTTSVEWASMDYYVSDLIDRGVIELFTPYTFSCYVMSTGSDYTPNILFFGDGLPNFSGAFCGTASTSWQRISITIEWASFDNRSYGIRFEAPTASPSGSHLRWACFQLERGRVATGWAPAPEDAQYAINDVNNNLVANYATTSSMNSAIQQKANEITSSVSQTYTTKAEFNNLEVGGANLVYNGGFNRNLDSWNVNGGSCGVQACTESPSGYMLRMDVAGYGHGAYQMFTFHDSTYCTDYVVSFYAKSNVDGLQMYASMEWDPATNTVFTLNGGWQKCVYKFRRSNPGANALVFYSNGVGTGSIYIHSIKMEKGTVPSAWSPHPSEIENKVNNLSNNLANNYSTTTQMNSAIQQKANEITSSVSQTYATKQSVTDVNNNLSAMNDTVVGYQKWLFEQYTNNQNVGTGNGTYPTLAHLANETLISSRLVDYLPGYTSAIGDSYIGVYTVYLYYESAYTWSGYIISDDESTTYLNGVAVCQAASCTQTTFTMNFKKGINKLQIIHGEGGGGDGVTLSDLGPWKEYGAYPACVTAASSNHYASNSDIVQTVNDLTIKFTESGGYNLLQNGHADKGTSYWNNNGGGISVHAAAAGGATGNYFGTSFPHGISYYDWVQLLPNTHYVYQAKIWSYGSFGGNSSVPLHYWFSYDRVNNTGDGYTILDYQQNVSNTGTWTQCYLHFVTGNSNIYIRPFIYHSGVTADIYVTELMLSQSRVVQPWSPHPSEVYSGITQIDKDGIRVHHSNANSYTHMAPDGFFVNNNGTDVVQVTASGLYVQGNITSGSTIQGARITGSTFNSSNDVFQVLEDGTIETSFLAVNGAVSTDKLNVNDIENASYPKVLSEATTVYISPNGGVNAEEFYDGAYFTSLSNMLSVAPRNLNGYTLTIKLMSDLYENAALTWFHSGQVNFEMQGYTLYGYFYGYGASMCYRLYGNTNANNNGTWGHIKPNVGRAMGSYYYAVQFQYCQFAVNYVAVYPSASSGSSSGGIGVHRGATGIIFNAKACGDMRYLVRAEYAGRVHVNSTQGACNNATFCASTGGIITLNSSNNQAGRSTTGNPYWVGSGGLILCDQLLGMDKITFNNTSQSGSSSSSGSTTRKVTETVKATSADTYRSTVYNNWKGDGTVRQGDYGYGDCQGCWFFGNNLYTTMNAGTVTKVVIRIQRQSGGVNALQTLTVKSHNHTSRPSGAPTYTDTIGTCSCAVGSSIDLVITDSTTINKLKNCKGLGLSIGSASSPYAVCSGACSVIITYTTNS